MKRLTKTEEKQLSDLTVALTDATEKFKITKNRYIHAITTANEEMSSAVEAYAEALNALNSFREDIHSTMDEYESARSDKWRESEVGTEFQEWMEKWAEPFDELNIEGMPDTDEITQTLDEITGAVNDTLQTLEDLPIEL